MCNQQLRRAAGKRVCYNFVAMFDLFRLWLGAVLRGFRTRRSLMLENLALRQQLAVFKRQQPRPRLGAMDRLFWVVARRFWSQWKKVLVIVLPDTVVRWHRSGFKLYWAMLCKVRKPVGGGRRISKQIRELIFQMVADNPSWGRLAYAGTEANNSPRFLTHRMLISWGLLRVGQPARGL